MAVAVGVGGARVALGVGVAGTSVDVGAAVGTPVGGTTGISGKGGVATGAGASVAVAADVGISATAAGVGVGKWEESTTTGSTSRSVGLTVGAASTSETTVFSGVGILGEFKPGNRTMLRGVLVNSGVLIDGALVGEANTIGVEVRVPSSAIW